jgi:DeoR/GlpR family transcriptional regulator of sugar metabolism
MSDTAQVRPSASEREAAIISEVHTSGFASVAALSAALAVSEMTIRRDIRRLAGEGELRVVHGGVSLSHGTLKTATFAGRAEEQSEAKQRIARAALSLVPSTGTVAFDSGTTCFAAAAGLDRDFRGCVVTHSVPVLQQMLTCPQATVIGLGGELLAESQVLIGPSTTAAAAGLSIDLFFLGANSVDPGGVYLRGNREKPVKSALMAAAAQVVLLVDGSKLTHTAPVRLAELSALSTLITDGPVPAAVSAAAKQSGVRILLAG